MGPAFSITRVILAASVATALVIPNVTPEPHLGYFKLEAERLANHAFVPIVASDGFFYTFTTQESVTQYAPLDPDHPDASTIVYSNADKAVGPSSLFLTTKNMTAPRQIYVDHQGRLAYVNNSQTACPDSEQGLATFEFNPAKNTGAAEHGRLKGRRGRGKFLACPQDQLPGAWGIRLDAEGTKINKTLRKSCETIKIASHHVSPLEIPSAMNDFCNRCANSTQPAKLLKQA